MREGVLKCWAVCEHPRSAGLYVSTPEALWRAVPQLCAQYMVVQNTNRIWDVSGQDEGTKTETAGALKMPEDFNGCRQSPLGPPSTPSAKCQS